MYECMLSMDMDDMGAEGVDKLRENGENGGITIFIWSANCLLHIYHLMFKKSLPLDDKVVGAMRLYQKAARRYLPSFVEFFKSRRDTANHLKLTCCI